MWVQTRLLPPPPVFYDSGFRLRPLTVSSGARTSELFRFVYTVVWASFFKLMTHRLHVPL
jgi:hypothetical protein